MSTYFGLSLFLLADTSSPALGKNLSDGTERLLVHTNISWLECLASYIGDDATSTSIKRMMCALHSSV